MKKFAIFITLLFVAAGVKAQDVIVLNSGKSIKSKITAVLSFSIEYKEFDSLAGPAYSVNKSDVFVIIFKNGKKEIITPPPTAEGKKTTEENEFRSFLKSGTFLLSGSSSLAYSSTTINTREDDASQDFMVKLGLGYFVGNYFMVYTSLGYETMKLNKSISSNAAISVGARVYLGSPFYLNFAYASLSSGDVEDVRYFIPAIGATVVINPSFAIEPEINYMLCLKHQFPNQIGMGFAFVYIF